MSRIRIGIVGAGVIARRHARTLAAFDDVEIAAVADVQESRARDLAASVEAAPYTDARHMLEREALDAVYVCVPPYGHGDVERAVVERDLPLFVEKPLATDYETAEEIAERIAHKGLITGVGHHWRWLDTVERAQELLADRPVRLATGYWLDATPPVIWWQQQDMSGGQFVEQATHVVDLARVLVGEVEEVFAYATRAPRPAYPDSTISDVTAASLRFSDGAVASISSTCILGWPHRIGLHLFSEGLAIELSEKELVVDAGRGRSVHTASGDPFRREDRAFVDAVQGRTDRTRVTYADALGTHRVTTTALRSASLGRPLHIDAAAAVDVPVAGAGSG